MAYTITNDDYADPSFSPMPACHQELADQTLVAGALTTTTVNTGIAGLKWARLRGIIKTLGDYGGTDTMRISLQVGTGAALTGPVTIAQKTLTFTTGDTAQTFDLMGWSNAGFQSWTVIIAGSGGDEVSVLDLEFDAA